jgi:hypothetical protein
MMPLQAAPDTSANKSQHNPCLSIPTPINASTPRLVAFQSKNLLALILGFLFLRYWTVFISLRFLIIPFGSFLMPSSSSFRNAPCFQCWIAISVLSYVQVTIAYTLLSTRYIYTWLSLVHSHAPCKPFNPNCLCYQFASHCFLSPKFSIARIKSIIAYI